MKIALLVVALFGAPFSIVSGQWLNISATWIAGTTQTNTISVVGTTGVPSTTIYPGSRQTACFAVNGANDVYLYGGQGYVTSTLAYLKDFWRYNIATAEWTMLPQNSVSTAVTGTKGVESSLVFPGTMGRQACLISSRDNNLYMFGGTNAAFFNDLWRYNLTSGNWTWLGGGTSTTATIGVESSTIYPIIRRSPGFVHLPASNSFLVFGGYASPGTGNGEMNDMWKYSLATNAWTWVAGNQTVLSSRGVFDTKGSASLLNYPGYRALHSMVIDPQTSIVYVFGGLLFGTTEYLNDMWSYDDTVGMWTWISGTAASNQQAVKGASLAFDTTYTPGGRCASVLLPLNGTDYLAMHGGRGYGVASVVVSSNMNEMWLYSKSLKQWAWVFGSQETTSYGVRGTTSAGSYPLGRQLHNAAYLPTSGSQKSILIYGGNNGSYYNDMWKVDFAIGQMPSSTLSSSIAASSTAILASSTVTSSALPSSTALSSLATSSTLARSSSTYSLTVATVTSSSLAAQSSSTPAVSSATTGSSVRSSGSTSTSIMSTSTLKSTSVSTSTTIITSSSSLVLPASTSTMVAIFTTTIGSTAVSSSASSEATTSSSSANEQPMSSSIVSSDAGQSATVDDTASMQSPATETSTGDDIQSITVVDDNTTTQSLPSQTTADTAESNGGGVVVQPEIIAPVAVVTLLIIGAVIFMLCRRNSKPTLKPNKAFEDYGTNANLV